MWTGQIKFLLYRLTTARAGLKVGAAATVNPNSMVIVAPGRTLLAARITQLLIEAYASTSISRAIVTVHVIRGAGDGLNSSATIVVVATVPIISQIVVVAIINNFEISAAAAIHPDAVAIMTPTSAFLATRIAALLNHADVAVVSIHLAVVTVSVIGGAIDDLLC
jgi:hypothetical protein